MTNKTLIFKKIPTGLPVPGEHLAVEERPFDLAAPPPPGGLKVSLLYASFDPYLRGKMRPKDEPSYTPAYDIDGPFTNDCIGRVLESDAPGYAPGDLIGGHMPIAEYAVVTAAMLAGSGGFRRIDNPHGLKDLGLFLGPLGMPGLTAYASLYEIGRPRKGETIFISSAAGAVGQVVGAVAKHEGMRVVGSVGSDEKLEYILNVLGFDAGFNYKREKPGDALDRLVPEGLDIYYDNVGGEHLDAALLHMNTRGRLIESGMISGYNRPHNEYGVKNIMKVIQKQLTVRGFLVFDPNFGPKYSKGHQEQVGKWIAEGTFKPKLDITNGIDNAAEGFVSLFNGKSFGKVVLKIKDE